MANVNNVSEAGILIEKLPVKYLWTCYSQEPEGAFSHKIPRKSVQGTFLFGKVAACVTTTCYFPLNYMFLTGAVVWRCSVKKVFLDISQNSRENTCARVSFLVKLQAWGLTLLEKRLWHRCFSANFAKFLRIPFIKEHLWKLTLSLFPLTLSFLLNALNENDFTFNLQCPHIYSVFYHRNIIFRCFHWGETINNLVFQEDQQT